MENGFTYLDGTVIFRGVFHLGSQKDYIGFGLQKE